MRLVESPDGPRPTAAARSRTMMREARSMLRTTTAIVMLTLLTTTAAYSQATATAPRSAQGDLFRFSFNQTFTPANRVELSRQFEAYCREVLDTVPTNTPAEDAWVMAESKTSDT